MHPFSAALNLDSKLRLFDFSACPGYVSHELDRQLNHGETLSITTHFKVKKGLNEAERRCIIDITFNHEGRVTIDFHNDVRLDHCGQEFIVSIYGGCSRTELVYKLTKLVSNIANYRASDFLLPVSPIITELLRLLASSEETPDLLEQEEVTPGKRAFTVGDLYGPLRCEIDNCGQATSTLILTEAENHSLEVKQGSEAVNIIFERNLGIAVCSACRSKALAV